MNKQLVINFAAPKVHKKPQRKKTQNDIDIENYTREIREWRERQKEAYQRKDWCAVNWAATTIMTKKASLERLLAVTKRRPKELLL